MTQAVISTIGQDRPGIVNTLSEIVFDLGLSIEDSRMTVLGGEFAVLMAVSGDDAGLERLQRALSQLAKSEDFTYLFRKTKAREGRPQSIPYQVRVVAMDHPGIVHRIAGFFSARNINIRELETEFERAAHTGAPIFNLLMTVEIPHGTKVAQLRQEFETFCDEQDLDGTLSVPL